MDIDELIKTIDNDVKSPKPIQRRYPIRFIFLNNLEDIISLVEHIKKEYNCDVLYLSDFLKQEDTWMTIDEVCGVFNSISNNTVVLGLSEYLRFCDKIDFKVLLNRLTEIENNTNFRIYVPMLGLKERFYNDFWTNFYRRDAWGPVWEALTDSRRITIYKVVFPISDLHIIEQFYVVRNTKDWLGILKKTDLGDIVSISKTLSNFFDIFLPDQQFDVRNIPNYKEFLRVFFGLAIDFDYNPNEDYVWEELINYVYEKQISDANFIKIIKAVFNIADVDRIQLKDVVNWYIESENKRLNRWLLKHFVCANKEKFKYLNFVFSKIQDFETASFYNAVWFEIFEVNNADEYAEERRKILSYIFEHKNIVYEVDSKIADYLNRINNLPLRKAVKYLTSFSFSERKFILEKLKNSENFAGDLNLVKEVFPEVYHYLSWETIEIDNLDQENNWIIDYFKEYNKCKILDKKSQKIEELLSEYNKDKNSLCNWYYKFRNNRPENYDNFVWIDGLGMEWLPLLIYFFKQLSRSQNIEVEVEVSRVLLPSITEINKFNNVDKISILDDFIHKQFPYKYPDSIIEELKIIKDIASTLLGKLRNKLYITSDHGFSFLSQKKYGEFKRCNFSETSHEGRCILDKEVRVEDEYYCNWVIDGLNRKAVIALKHASLEDVPFREVHGGATPEEVIVPFIKLIKRTAEYIRYDMQLENNIVKVINPVIQIYINPEPVDAVEAFLENTVLNVERNNNIFNIMLDKNIKPGKKKLKIKIGNYEQSFEIEIIGGFQERELI